MKTLRFFGMMLMTMLMAFNFTACGDDNDDKSKDGGGSAPDYVGTWVDTDTKERMSVIILKTNSYQNVQYRFSQSTQKIKKEDVKGDMTVSGNVITLTGKAPFEVATYSISGNTMTITPQQSKEGTITLTRATETQLATFAAWEYAYTHQD